MQFIQDCCASICCQFPPASFLHAQTVVLTPVSLFVTFIVKLYEFPHPPLSLVTFASNIIGIQHHSYFMLKVSISEMILPEPPPIPHRRIEYVSVELLNPLLFIAHVLKLLPFPHPYNGPSVSPLARLWFK